MTGAPRRRYLASGLPSTDAMPAMPGGSAGPPVLRDFAAVHDAARRLPDDPRRHRRVLALTDQEAAAIRARDPRIALEEDPPLALFRMPGLPPMVDPEAGTRALRFRVVDAAGRGVPDCSVYALSAGVGYRGESGEDGSVSMTVGAGAVDRLVVSPRRDHWSRVLDGPLPDDGTLPPVALRPLRPGRDLGWVHALLDTPRAWHGFRATGAGVKVAIVDSGIAPGQGGLLPAGGLNTLDGADPAVWWVDEKGHGTHCAGVIAGSAGLPSGPFTGVAPGVELHALKVFPGGHLSDLVEAIDWCADRRMDLVNLSLGSPEPSPALDAALLRARLAGVTVIAASGNDATHVAYPASTKPAVLAVGAIGRRGAFPADSAHALKVGRYRDPSGAIFSARFSNFGQELDVAAPGVAITSTVPGGFAAWDGTSMACPLVTGVAALVLSVSPWLRTGDWRQVDALHACLRGAARDVGLPATVQGAGVPAAGVACRLARACRGSFAAWE